MPLSYFHRIQPRGSQVISEYLEIYQDQSPKKTSTLSEFVMKSEYSVECPDCIGCLWNYHQILSPICPSSTNFLDLWPIIQIWREAVSWRSMLLFLNTVAWSHYLNSRLFHSMEYNWWTLSKEYSNSWLLLRCSTLRLDQLCRNQKNSQSKSLTYLLNSFPASHRILLCQKVKKMLLFGL